MGRWSRRALPWLLPLVLFLAAAPARATPPAADHEDAASGATALETRLLAPCCWTQTLDVHESEFASSLRAEVHRRLRAGETAESIEEDFVVRYGERVRAVEKGSDTRGVVPAVAALAALLGAAGLVFWMRRRTGRGPAQAPVRASPVRDEYDDLLDDELRRLDT